MKSYSSRKIFLQIFLILTLLISSFGMVIAAEGDVVQPQPLSEERLQEIESDVPLTDSRGTAGEDWNPDSGDPSIVADTETRQGSAGEDIDVITADKSKIKVFGEEGNVAAKQEPTGSSWYSFSFPSSPAELSCQSGGSGFLSGSALGPLARPFEMMMTLLSNELSVYILMFIFMFMMLYGVIYAALGKVKVFDGQKRQGKIVAVSIAMMTNLSLFGITSRYGGPKAVLTRFLSTFELFGGILLATVMFLIVYYGFRQKEERSWKLALGAAGLALLLVGSIICAPTWTSIGFFILFLTLLFAGLFSLGNFGFGGDKGDDGSSQGGTGADPNTASRGGQAARGNIPVHVPSQVQGFGASYNPPSGGSR